MWRKFCVGSLCKLFEGLLQGYCTSCIHLIMLTFWTPRNIFDHQAVKFELDVTFHTTIMVVPCMATNNSFLCIGNVNLTKTMCPSPLSLLYLLTYPTPAPAHTYPLNPTPYAPCGPLRTEQHLPSNSGGEGGWGAWPLGHLRNSAA